MAVPPGDGILLILVGREGPPARRAV